MIAFDGMQPTFETGAAHVGSLDQGRRHPVVGAAQGGCVPGGPAADDGHVVLRYRHRIQPKVSRAGVSSSCLIR